MLNIKYSNQSVKFLKKLPRNIAIRMLNKIDKLQANPVIHDSKRVQNTNCFRVRVGKYRVLYEVDHKNNLLGIVKIDKRPRAY